MKEWESTRRNRGRMGGVYLVQKEQRWTRGAFLTWRRSVNDSVVEGPTVLIKLCYSVLSSQISVWLSWCCGRMTATPALQENPPSLLYDFSTPSRVSKPFAEIPILCVTGCSARSCSLTDHAEPQDVALSHPLFSYWSPEFSPIVLFSKVEKCSIYVL